MDQEATGLWVALETPLEIGEEAPLEMAEEREGRGGDGAGKGVASSGRGSGVG